MGPDWDKYLMKNRFYLNKRSNLFVTCKKMSLISLTQEATPNPKTVETSIRKKKAIVVTEAVTIVVVTPKRIIVLNERDLLPEITTSPKIMTSKVRLKGNQRSITNQQNAAAQIGNQISMIPKTNSTQRRAEPQKTQIRLKQMISLIWKSKLLADIPALVLIHSHAGSLLKSRVFLLDMMFTETKEGQEVEVKTDFDILLIKTRRKRRWKNLQREETIVTSQRGVTEIGVTEQIGTTMTGEKIRRLLKASMNW